LIHQNIIQYKEVLYRFFPYQVLSVSCLTVVSAERIYVLERAVVHVSRSYALLLTKQKAEYCADVPEMIDCTFQR
jgi:hypothetical protein